MEHYKGHLYYVDENRAKHHMAEFDVTAISREQAERLVLDEHWDDRLDAASCAPHIEFTE